MIVFWATWSERSLQELADLNSLAAKLADQPVRFLAVNVESLTIAAEDSTAIDSIVSRLELRFPVILDRGLEFFYLYGVIAVPSTAIISSSGKLLYGPPGYSLTTRDRLEDSILTYLNLDTTSAVSPWPQGFQPADRASRYYRLALKLLRLGSLERALVSLDRAQADDPTFPEPFRLMGDVLLRQNRMTEALEQYEAAIALDSSLVSAWTGRGQALYLSGRVQAAEASLTRAIELDSGHVSALVALSRCWLDQSRTSDALEILTRAASLDDNDLRILYFLGKAHAKRGDTGNAAAAYMTALELLYPPP